MEYNAIALNDRFEKGRISGSLTISSSAVKFTCKEGEVIFPMRNIEISTGGAGERLIYFRHKNFPEWCIYTGDKNILNDPNLVNEKSSHKLVKKVARSNRLIIYSIIGVVMFFATILLSIIIFRDTIIHVVANRIPVPLEEKAGIPTFEMLKLQKDFIKDPQLNKKINELGSHITNALTDNPYNFTFYLVKDSTINAYAIPGAKIIIHSGVIEQAESTEEILGVMSHEIAHITEKHSMRKLITDMGLRYLIIFLFDPGSYLTDKLFEAGGKIHSMKYTRDLEKEADEKGWEYLQQANINPIGMISYFKKMQKLLPKEDLHNESATDWLSTHPATSERIRLLEDKYAKTEKKQYNKEIFDLKGFKKELAKSIQ